MSDSADTEQPTLYKSVVLQLCEQWRRKAQGLRENDDDDSVAAAYAMEWCAGHLEGLANL